MMKLILSVLITITCLGIPELNAQAGFHFGMKAGPSLANQTWNEGERRMLPTFHGNLFIESRDPNDKGSLYAQLGLHTRGSSLRVIGFGGGLGSIDSGYKFQNISLAVGAKKNVASNMRFQPYYFAGIRLEYNLSNNLRELLETCNNFTNNNFVCPYPDPNFINDITYGISIGGGLELSQAEFFTSALEFTFSPDLSYQFQRPTINNVSTPQPGNTTRQELQVRNVTFEISLVLKFLREIIYTN